MSKEKKKSFLYNIYKKCRSSDTDVEMSEEVNSTSAEDEQPAAPVPPSEELLRKWLDKQYLKPLLDFCTTADAKELSANNISDVLDLENFILAPVETLEYYPVIEKYVSDFVKEICVSSRELLNTILQETETPRDAQLFLKTSPDKMYAFMFILPPYLDGNEITRELLSDALKKTGISYGLNAPSLELVLTNKSYMQIFLLARGIPPVNGSDGQIINAIELSSEMSMQEDANGNIDFKNLGLVTSVKKEQLICEIVLPTDGVDGKDVSNKVLSAKSGKPVPPPNGKNTAITDNGTKLVASENGQLIYKNHQYAVEQLLVIRENVDYGVGNIDFSGNVMVYGDVCSGFIVKADGNITINGMVESAEIIAGGDVLIKKGMNGNFKGSISAGGSIKVGFLENCNIYCSGTLYSNSVVSCNVSSEDSVIIQGSLGVLIGGNITAYKSVEARVIGSKSRRETSITLGVMPQLHEKQAQAQSDWKETIDTLDKLNKNIMYLLKIAASLPPDKKLILSQLQEQQQLYSTRKLELEDTLSVLQSMHTDFTQCRLKCNMAFPPVKVVIGSETEIIANVCSKCDIYLGEDGTIKGIV